MNLNEFLWVEKYRPKTVNECILVDHLKEFFNKMIKDGEVQNLLLTGSAGCGKTTIAKALCDEIGTDWILINGSEDNGIDILRTKIRNFASTVSMSGKTKIVILDEADHLNPTSFQPAFRGFIEEFSKSCRFILTCNNESKIIKPLHSRLLNVNFKMKKEDKPKLAKAMMVRLMSILKEENVSFENETLAMAIQKYFPDFRKLINEIQRNCSDGSLLNTLLGEKDLRVEELVTFLKEKEWNKMRKWVVDNIDNDVNYIYKNFYNFVIDKTDQIPHLVVLMAKYQYQSAFSADQEINLVAFFTEIMSEVEFK